ncbi:MAG TPA: hypothetical protein PLC15_03880, partial [Candidatus Obscuribacter sp.]|nr:hypothetical protein [Candidatus Obscuribacter sp.]
MPDDIFPAVKERIDNFKLSQIHTPEEWQCFFDDGILLLDHVEDRMKEYAIERMQKGIWSENSQHYQQPDFKAAPASQRLQPILDAILRQQQEKERCLLRFTMWSSLSEDQREFFSQWLDQAEADGIISREAAETARIQTELYAKEEWNLARSFLEPFFEHPDDLLRAAAAAAFGEMYVDG